uniref:Envelope-like protein n=1 Tax=Macrostomum lignano TaxID=282301 RepID=A0A1I8H404_9PLAT
FDKVLEADTLRQLEWVGVPGAHYCGKFDDIKPTLELIRLPNEQKGIDDGMPLHWRSYLVAALFKWDTDPDSSYPVYFVVAGCC